MKEQSQKSECCNALLEQINDFRKGVLLGGKCHRCYACGKHYNVPLVVGESAHCQPSQKEGEEKVPDRLLEIISKIEINKKLKIDLFLLLLQEMGGMLQHLASIGASWGAEVKQDRVAASMEYYLKIVEKIKSLILEEYDNK